MESFSIFLGRPRHGWLPFEIKVGEYSVSDEASDLGLNVIDQLVSMLDNVKINREAECYFYLEPSAYFLKLEPCMDATTLTIQFVDNFDESEDPKRVTLVHASIDRRQLQSAITEVLKGFRQYEFEDYDWPLPENWHRLEGLRN
jgi:hypothetical protein